MTDEDSKTPFELIGKKARQRMESSFMLTALIEANRRAQALVVERRAAALAKEGVQPQSPPSSILRYEHMNTNTTNTTFPCVEYTGKTVLLRFTRLETFEFNCEDPVQAEILAHSITNFVEQAVRKAPPAQRNMLDTTPSCNLCGGFGFTHDQNGAMIECPNSGL